MRISVITRWYNEEFFAPYFLSHYAWADEIVILLEQSTTDRSAQIIRKFKNARIEWCDHGGMIDDGVFSNEMSDLAEILASDWVVRVDGDELIFPPDGANPREAIAHADGNVIVTLFRWVYRHKDDADLDPTKPAVPQRRHGGDYTMWPGMGSTFTKPNIVRPSTQIRWKPGEQGYFKNSRVRLSETVFNGVHWQMVDVEEAVKRLLSAEARLSEVNKKHGWGVRRFTEEQIRRECKAHENDPIILDL